MTAFTEKLDRAAAAATCDVLDSLGGALTQASVFLSPAGPKALIPLGLGGASYLASNALCPDGWDPAKPGPDPSGAPIDYCSQAASPTTIWTFTNGINTNVTAEVAVITKFDFTNRETDPSGYFRDFYDFRGTTPGGAAYRTELVLALGLDDESYFEQRFEGDPTCEVPITPADDTPTIPPYEYTDPEDDCNIKVTLKGFVQDQNQRTNPVYKIEPSETGRTGGGRIGGCTFSPVIYTGGPPGGPPNVGPWNPTWDDGTGGQTPWGDFIRDLMGGLLGNFIYDALGSLFATPSNPALFQLDAHCQFDSEGNPLKVQVEIPALPALDSISTKIEALVPIIQAHKNFDQPTCPEEPPTYLGDIRTISFISEEVSPTGKSCLRKRLRYRSESGIGLDELITHWAGFSFSAGPVIVQHRGATWGTVKVWASSIDEGKRVILHAASEAGIDANQVGRWQISGSTSSRLGMPGTMKVNKTGGYYWITARDGSDNRPIVGKT